MPPPMSTVYTLFVDRNAEWISHDKFICADDEDFVEHILLNQFVAGGAIFTQQLVYISV